MAVFLLYFDRVSLVVTEPSEGLMGFEECEGSLRQGPVRKN